MQVSNIILTIAYDIIFHSRMIHNAHFQRKKNPVLMRVKQQTIPMYKSDITTGTLNKSH